jgi:hypothetical protein
MKKLIISAFFSTLFNFSFCQDSIPRLSFEFGINQHNFKMDSLNDKFIEAAINNPNVKLLDKKIESGLGLNFKVAYQFTRAVAFGLYVDYQYGLSEYNPMYPMGNNPPVEGIYSVRVDNLNSGINLSYWLSSHFYKSTSSKALQRLNYGLSLNVGYGLGSLKQFTYVPNYELASSDYRVFSNYSFFFRPELKMEYLITNVKLFSSIGLNIGYQSFNIGYIKTKADEYEMLVGFPNTKMQLDFSGFYYGIYLKLAR